MSSEPIHNKSLGEIFGNSLTANLCVNIEKGTQIWVATGMLAQYLESFTDGVVVRENDKPLGVVGGKDVIENIVKNPSPDWFESTKVEDVMEKRILTISKETTLKELVQFWQQTRRAFALIPNEFSDYSAISAKKLLEVGMKCKTDIPISMFPEKEVITFAKDNTIGEIMKSMLENGTRRLLLEDLSQFVNDRMILESITEEHQYLRGAKNFLGKPISDFKLVESKRISEDLSIPQVSKMLYEMEHPYVIFQTKIVTPWDICLALMYEEITEFQ